MKRLLKVASIMSFFSTAQVMALACGDFISSDTTLIADLLNCPGNGLTITANYVTLDLNGHTIDGSGSGNGISIAAGLYKVNVVGGGTVKDFYNGVVVNDGLKHKLSNIRIWGAQQGLHAMNMSKSTVHKLHIFGGVNGIRIEGSSEDNELIFNDITAVTSEAISIREGAYNTLKGNYLLDNQTGLAIVAGIKNFALQNHMIGNTNGILISPGYPSPLGNALKNTIYENKIYNNHTGIWLNSYSSPGFVMENVIEKNAIFGGSQGLLIDDPNDVNNEIINNYFVDQSVFHIRDFGTSTLLSGNRCNGSAC